MLFYKNIEEQYILLQMHVEEYEIDDVIDVETSNELTLFSENINSLEINTLLNGVDDDKDAVLSIHPGAGGKESQDWAYMLFRMYVRWAEDNDLNYSILNYQDGDETGIKDVSIEIRGVNIYGRLKSEQGIHRLVRISPFDSNSRRHTSFAAIYIHPIIDDDIVININEKDLKIDTYRASGAGGQHVNKTDSAVRITHLPTNIVVQCQNQRSQLKNKNTALKILKSRLYKLKLDELDNDKNVSDKKDIGWGSQIRSYVFHPYNLVKDHRTSYNTSNINKVLDGDINRFIKKYLLLNMENKNV
tara:strand:+ start:1239 stop:2144 length:906 start_codon:yes stop_codon:yes gene_type:complete